MSTPQEMEEVEQLEELLSTNRKTLTAYLKQQTALGGTGYSSPGIINGMEEARSHIRKIKAMLRTLGVAIDDWLYDEKVEEGGASFSLETTELSGKPTPLAPNNFSEVASTGDKLRSLAPRQERLIGSEIKETSLAWALKHLVKFGDTDLFPKPIEIDILQDTASETVQQISGIDLRNYIYSPSRRFIVPKDDISYRTATQLDPVDSIVLSAIIYEYGNLIEKRRAPVVADKVFGYRFLPKGDGALYNPKISWVEFWKKCKEKISQYRYAVYLDIADFYNQIYHENIANQLTQSGFPAHLIEWVMGLLSSITAGIPRGIPVGPHATHILGELSLIPIDNSLSARGLDFCRFVDDIVIFCDEYEDAKIIIYQMASVLDSQQRLILQRHKTRIFDATEFDKHCDAMIQDRPINKFEEDILAVIRTHSKISPYKSLDINKLTKKELSLFTKALVEGIIGEYLKEKEPNYTRLRWFLRRLSQFGIPSAVEYCIKHIDILTPAIADTSQYLVSAAANYKGNWKDLGARVLKMLQSPIMRSNEYFQMSLLSLFSRNSLLNNSGHLIALYQLSAASLRREILLSAYKLEIGDWIRELKESYSGLDPWTKRALIIAAKSLPYEERNAFLASKRDSIVLDELLIKWAMMKS